MNELYKLDQTAAEGYANYNFPKGESSSCSWNLQAHTFS